MYDYYCVMLYMISEDKVDNIPNTIFIYYLFIFPHIQTWYLNARVEHML